ncbi:MAG: hypothetical protein ACREDZ_12260 [Kiloniellales bacterium]
MGLSTRAVETLLDLVEIKLSCIEIYDREDSRELSKLEQCRDELLSIAGRGRGKSELLGFPTRGRQQPA